MKTRYKVLLGLAAVAYVYATFDRTALKDKSFASALLDPLGNLYYWKNRIVPSTPAVVNN